MISFVMSLFGWLPPVLQVIVFGMIGIFIIWSILKIVALIMDIIPLL